MLGSLSTARNNAKSQDDTQRSHEVQRCYIAWKLATVSIREGQDAFPWDWILSKLPTIWRELDIILLGRHISQRENK